MLSFLLSSVFYESDVVSFGVPYVLGVAREVSP